MSRHLHRIYEANAKALDLGTAITIYAAFLGETRKMLFTEASRLYNQMPHPKRRGILKNTKSYIKMRLDKPLKKAEIINLKLQEGDSVEGEIEDLIRLSDTVLYFTNYFCGHSST